MVVAMRRAHTSNELVDTLHLAEDIIRNQRMGVRLVRIAEVQAGADMTVAL
jgi:hypothetical protein